MGSYNQTHESPREVHANYVSRMQDVGWSMQQENRWPLVAWKSKNIDARLKEWAETQEPAEMSIVIVPSDREIGELPLKTLGYISSALATIASLRERHGVNVTNLRILSPVHVNATVDGGDRAKKLQNAAYIAHIAQVYAKHFYPSLTLAIHSDTGEEITPKIHEELRPHIERLAVHQHVQTELRRSARQHNDEVENTGNLAEGIALYLLAHGPAWGYTNPSPLFSANHVYRAPARIVYAPPSELRFFALATETGLIKPEEADKILTLIAGKQTYPPYYSYLTNEPTIRHVLEGATIQRTRDELTRQKLHGNPMGADVITNLNILLTDETRAAKDKSRRGTYPTVAQVLQEALQVA